METPNLAKILIQFSSEGLDGNWETIYNLAVEEVKGLKKHIKELEKQLEYLNNDGYSHGNLR